MELDAIFKSLDLGPDDPTGGDLGVHSPIDGAEIALVASDTLQTVDAKIARAATAFNYWPMCPRRAGAT